MATIKEITKAIEEATPTAEKRYQVDNHTGKSSKDINAGMRMFEEKVLDNPAMVKAFEELEADWDHIGQSLGAVTNVKKFSRGIQTLLFLASGKKNHLQASARMAALIFAGIKMGVNTKSDLKKFVLDQEVAGIDRSKQKRILAMGSGVIGEGTYSSQASAVLSSGGIFDILNIGKAWRSRDEDVGGLVHENSPMAKRMKFLIEKLSGVSLDM